MTDELTPAEIAEVTGKKRPASQAAALARQGVPFTFLGRAIKVSRQIAQAHALLQHSSLSVTRQHYVQGEKLKPVR